jgi:hypothetical protein
VRTFTVGGQRLAFEPAQFGPPAATQAPAAAVPAVPPLANVELANAAELRGAVAVVRRGGCQFHEKARRAQQAGAVALVIVNTEDAPFAMESSREAQDILIPTLGVGKADGERLLLGGAAAVTFAYDMLAEAMEAPEPVVVAADVGGVDEPPQPLVAPPPPPEGGSPGPRSCPQPAEPQAGSPGPRGRLQLAEPQVEGLTEATHTREVAGAGSADGSSSEEEEVGGSRRAVELVGARLRSEYTRATTPFCAGIPYVRTQCANFAYKKSGSRQRQ